LGLPITVGHTGGSPLQPGRSGGGRVLAIGHCIMMGSGVRCMDD
jgi:hypothetical protein